MNKKLLFSAIFMVIFSLCTNAQNPQPKLNQAELCKKFSGVWHQQINRDTIQWFEMRLFKDAVLETIYQTVNDVKELTGAICFRYDPELDKFKGFWVQQGGQIHSFYFKFSSDKEIEFESVDDFKSNKVTSRNKFVFIDQDHINGFHYNSNNVQYSTSKWVKISSLQ